MNQSETIQKLATALGGVQKGLTPVAKDKINPFFNSRYVGLDTVMPLALELLAAHGLSVAQMPDSVNGGSSALTTMLMHESGEWLSAIQPLMLAKDDPQGQGSAITYARRYAIMSLLGLVAEDDDDGNAASAPSPAQQYAESGRQAAAPESRPTAAGGPKKAPTKYDGKCYVCGGDYYEGDEVYYQQIEGKWVRWHEGCETSEQ